jgi:hypothetical protein
LSSVDNVVVSRFVFPSISKHVTNGVESL